MSKLVQLLDNLTGRPNALRDEANEAKEELDLVVAILEWYADKKNHESHTAFEAHGVMHIGPSYIEADGGKRAVDGLEVLTGIKRERGRTEVYWTTELELEDDERE